RCFHASPSARALHSSPTRRSSDLCSTKGPVCGGVTKFGSGSGPANTLVPTGSSASIVNGLKFAPLACALPFELPPLSAAGSTERSEEHTSELQSRENLVCRLLLEK